MKSTEKIATGAMGIAKDVKAIFKGLSGVFKHLMEDHGKVSVLIKRVKDSDTETRARLYPEIREELLAHENGELRAVYPVFAEYPSLRDIVAEHADHASELRNAIEIVDTISIDSPAWSGAFERLAQIVDEHVEREESDWFPKAQEAIGDDRAERLRSEFEAARSSS